MLLDIINKKIEEQLTKTVEKLIEEIKLELDRQGHRGSGKLKESIRYEIKQLPGVVEAVVFMANYGRYVDRGVKASNVPFSGTKKGSGGNETSEYIQGLQRFWILKGLSRDEALSAAFATAHKHKKEGMPTNKSFSFSKNGKREGFFTDTVTKFESEIGELIEDTQNVVRVVIADVINRRVKEFEVIEIL